jgi:hypothetical protein
VTAQPTLRLVSAGAVETGNGVTNETADSLGSAVLVAVAAPSYPCSTITRRSSALTPEDQEDDAGTTPARGSTIGGAASMQHFAERLENPGSGEALLALSFFPLASYDLSCGGQER